MNEAWRKPTSLSPKHRPPRPFGAIQSHSVKRGETLRAVDLIKSAKRHTTTGPLCDKESFPGRRPVVGKPLKAVDMPQSAVDPGLVRRLTNTNPL